jgi:hypothetical protein
VDGHPAMTIELKPRRSSGGGEWHGESRPGTTFGMGEMDANGTRASTRCFPFLIARRRPESCAPQAARCFEWKEERASLRGIARISQRHERDEEGAASTSIMSRGTMAKRRRRAPPPDRASSCLELKSAERINSIRPALRRRLRKDFVARAALNGDREGGARLRVAS